MEIEEEKKLEAEALSQIDPEAIKAEIITEFGFDETDDAERIEKAVAREVKTRTFAAKAIGSKIKTRDELEALKKTIPPVKKETNASPEELDRKLDEKLNERLEARDLEALEYSDEVKAEVKKVAKAQGISVKKATQDPYIQFKVGEYEKAKKVEEASIGRTNRQGKTTAFDISKPPDVDMTTEEGRKEWEAWKAEGKKKGF